MKNVNIVILKDETSEVTREGMGEWDGDDIAWHTSIRGFRIGVGEYDYDFIKPAPALKEYFLVYARYSTGDSFHHETGKVCLVSLCDTYNDANAIAQAINTDYDETKDIRTGPLKVHLPDANREEEIYTGTWKGYFEGLESIEVEPVGGQRLSIRKS